MTKLQTNEVDSIRMEKLLIVLKEIRSRKADDTDNLNIELLNMGTPRYITIIYLFNR